MRNGLPLSAASQCLRNDLRSPDYIEAPMPTMLSPPKTCTRAALPIRSKTARATSPTWCGTMMSEKTSRGNGKYDGQVDQVSQALNRLRAMASVPRFSPPMPRPPSGDRGWMA